jgi:hypothetical protein
MKVVIGWRRAKTAGFMTSVLASRLGPSGARPRGGWLATERLAARHRLIVTGAGG